MKEHRSRKSRSKQQQCKNESCTEIAVELTQEISIEEDSSKNPDQSEKGENLMVSESVENLQVTSADSTIQTNWEDYWNQYGQRLLWQDWVAKNPEICQSNSEPWNTPDTTEEWNIHYSESYWNYCEQFNYWAKQGWTFDSPGESAKTHPAEQDLEDAELPNCSLQLPPTLKDLDPLCDGVVLNGLENINLDKKESEQNCKPLSVIYEGHPTQDTESLETHCPCDPDHCDQKGGGSRETNAPSGRSSSSQPGL